MTPLLALEGNIHEDDYDDVKQELSDLRVKLRESERQTEKYRSEADRMGASVVMIRKTLSPLYTGLRALFGEIEVVAGRESVNEPLRPAQTLVNSEVWESWKARLGPACAKIIDAMLLHKSMNQTQISIASGVSRGNIPTYLSRMKKANLINKNGNEYSLKEL